MASWFILVAQIALALSRGPAADSLNGVCEQSATSCLMVTHTISILGARVVSMAHRGSEHSSTMLSGVEPAGKVSVC